MYRLLLKIALPMRNHCLPTSWELRLKFNRPWYVNLQAGIRIGLVQTGC